jgi:hypothetical protein
MIRTLEIYCLVGLPLGVSAFLVGVFIKRLRIVLLVLSVGLLASWCFSAQALKKRSFIISNRLFSNAAEVVESLGQPEAIFAYPEGDSEWVYSVRLWPWNVAGNYAVYRNHLISASIDRTVGLFYKPVPRILTPTGSKDVKKFLDCYDSGRVNLPPVRGTANQ